MGRTTSYLETCAFLADIPTYGTYPSEWREAAAASLGALRPPPPRGLLLTVFIALFCDYALNSMAVPIIPLYLRRLDIGHWAIGCLFAIKPAVQVLGNALAGPMVHRLGADWTLLSGLGVLAVATAVFGVGLSQGLEPQTTYAILLLARGVQGLSSAFLIAAGMTWIAQTHSPESRGMGMSMVLVGVGAGAMCGAGFAGFLAALIGNAGPFYLMALLLLLDSLIILGVRSRAGRQGSPPSWKAAPGSDATEWRRVLRLLRESDILCINALVFVGNAGMTALQPTFPLYVRVTLGYSQRGQGLMWGMMAFVYLLARPLSSFLADRWRNWAVILLGQLVLSAGFVVLGAAPLAWTILAGLCLIAFGVAFITTPCMPLLADVIELHGSKQYGVFYSMVDVATSLGMICGPLLGSYLRERCTFEDTFRTIALLTAPAVVCSFVLRTTEADVPRAPAGT